MADTNDKTALAELLNDQLEGLFAQANKYGIELYVVPAKIVAKVNGFSAERPKSAPAFEPPAAPAVQTQAAAPAAAIAPPAAAPETPVKPATTRTSAKSKAADKLDAGTPAFKKAAEKLGLPAEPPSFLYNGKNYKVVALKPASQVRPVLVQDEGGQLQAVPVKTVTAALAPAA